MTRLLSRIDGRLDFVYERYSLWSYAAMEFAGHRRIPGLLEVNAPLVTEQAAHRSLRNRPAAEAVARRVFGAASAILAVSDGVAAYLDGLPQARGKVTVVPNGVNPSAFARPVEPASPSDLFTVGFVGTLKPWHGMDVLIDAFHRFHRAHPASRLLVVGDGPERAALAGAAISRGLEGSVSLTGAVPPRSVPTWLASMHLAVAPYPGSGDFYFSPLKLYEYMAGGLPVVASRIGQVAQVIRDGITGILCTPGVPAEFAAAFARLYDDVSLARRIGDAARADACEHHTWAAVASRTLALVAATRQTAVNPSARGAQT